MHFKMIFLLFFSFSPSFPVQVALFGFCYKNLQNYFLMSWGFVSQWIVIQKNYLVLSTLRVLFLLAALYKKKVWIQFSRMEITQEKKKLCRTLLTVVLATEVKVAVKLKEKHFQNNDRKNTLRNLIPGEESYWSL